MLPYRFCFFFFVFEGNSKYKPPGAYIRRGDLMGGFSVTNLGGLYLEGLVRGGGYLRNFTYIHLCWKFSGYDSCTFWCHLSGCEKGLKSFNWMFSPFSLHLTTNKNCEDHILSIPFDPRISYINIVYIENVWCWRDHRKFQILPRMIFHTRYFYE